MEIDVGGAQRTGTTGGDGRCRFADLPRGDAVARFVDPKAVQDLLDKRWAPDRPEDWIVAPHGATVLELSSLVPDWRPRLTLQAQTTNVVVLEPPYSVRLFDEAGRIMANLPCSVLVGDAKHELTSDEDGWIEFPVGHQCPEYVTVAWKQGRVARAMKVRLECHEGQPEDVARSRLWNLGYQYDDEDEAAPAFQNETDMPVADGDLSSEVIARIDEHWTKRNG